MSFSQAAAELYVSQPSVSRQIKLLETELGYQLFDRTRKNQIGLTPAGVIFRENFRAAERNFQQARAAVQALSTEEPRQLRVGVGLGWDLSDILSAFRAQVTRQYPQAELSFESRSFQTLREKLRAGTLDAILCTRTSIMDFEALEIRQVAELESRAYVRRGLLRPAGEPLQIQDFNGQNLLMLREAESPMAMELARMLFLSHQVNVNPVWLPNRETILQAVLMGEGLMVFDQFMYFSADPRLTFYRLDDTIPICVVWRRGAHNPLIGLFADTLSALLAQKNPSAGRG